MSSSDEDFYISRPPKYKFVSKIKEECIDSEDNDEIEPPPMVPSVVVAPAIASSSSAVMTQSVHLSSSSGGNVTAASSVHWRNEVNDVDEFFRHVDEISDQLEEDDRDFILEGEMKKLVVAGCPLFPINRLDLDKLFSWTLIWVNWKDKAEDAADGIERKMRKGRALSLSEYIELHNDSKGNLQKMDKLDHEMMEYLFNIPSPQPPSPAPTINLFSHDGDADDDDDDF